MADRETTEEIARAEAAVAWFRSIAIRALVAYAIVLSVAFGVGVSQLIQTRESNDASRSAVVRADAALAISHRTEGALQAEVHGLCMGGVRIVSFTNEAHRFLHATLREAGEIQLRAARIFRLASTPAFKREQQIGESFARSLITGARHIKILPPVRCTVLAAHPRTYAFPKARPIEPPKHG